jgi:hypothetical protein
MTAPVCDLCVVQITSIFGPASKRGRFFSQCRSDPRERGPIGSGKKKEPAATTASRSVRVAHEESKGPARHVIYELLFDIFTAVGRPKSALRLEGDQQLPLDIM